MSTFCLIESGLKAAHLFSFLEHIKHGISASIGRISVFNSFFAIFLRNSIHAKCPHYNQGVGGIKCNKDNMNYGR